MNVVQLLILQFIAHLLTDYIFQTDKKAKNKNEEGFKSRYLKGHILMMFALSWLLSFQWWFFTGALFIALTHWLIDGFKKYLNQNRFLGKYAFFIDQGLHFGVIVLTVLLYEKYFSLETVIPITKTKYLALVAFYLFCSKPANILIKEIFRITDVHFDKKNDDLPNAGRLIGTIERWLVFTFIIIDQFEAVGFLIAAKSILRFKDDNSLKTEYVLIGTMLSFGIAIAAGVIYGWL